MFRKILIANRGEIALRILRACRTLGVEAVVAYSEADRDSPAGPARRRGDLHRPGRRPALATSRRRPSSRRRSSPAATRSTPATASCPRTRASPRSSRAHDLTFIGPPADVLERFASKEGTRRLLGGHGLPTIPGSDGMLRDDEHALAEAERIGYPVLIKPSAGGGGKGMRMVRTPRELRVRDQGLPVRGPRRLRRRLALPREVARRQPPRRGPGRGRPLRPRRPPRRARLLRPAPPPEDPRGGARRRPSRRPPGPTSATGRSGPSSRPATRTSARSSSSSTGTATSTSSRSTAGSRWSTR